MEQWKAIDGFEGFYEASTLGRIRSIDRVVHQRNKWGEFSRIIKGKIVKGTVDNNGYVAISLQKNGKIKYTKVHILIAKTFIDNYNNLPQVNHKDENKQNNEVSNLEWCTAKYNMNYGTVRSRTAMAQGKKVQQIKDGNVIRVFDSLHEINRELGYNFKNICSVCNGKRNSAHGFEWKYLL